MKNRTHPEKEDTKNIIVLDEGINELVPAAVCCYVGWWFPYKPGV
jgi:hypothetical protein